MAVIFRLSLVSFFLANLVTGARHPHPHPADGNAIVHTRKQGTFIGNRLAAGVDEYLGIPFAAAPTGVLRFAKTRGAASNTDTHDATQPGAICVQPPSTDSTPDQRQSEDCLNLNVYAPPVSSKRKNGNYPVMVWLYGGSWQEGSINEPRLNATSFVRRSIQLGEPVVWVAPNYRVGAFGFLAGKAVVDVEQAGGQATRNAALWDQHQALQWVQDNIASFGGDPKRVILYGQSAGAANVGQHLMADCGRGSRGLFQGAILESGNAATGRRLPATHPDVEATYQYILQGAGCSNTTSSADQISCLQRKSTDEVNAGNNLAIANAYIAYQPVLDNFFIRQLPSAQWLSRRYLRVPIITGDTLDEGTEFPYPDTVTNDTAFLQAQEFGLGEQIAPIGAQILQTWSSDPAKGEPYRPEFFAASPQDTFYPPNGTNQYKRQASMFQDVFFEAGRHLQLQAAKTDGVAAWSYRFAQLSPVGVGPDAGIAMAAMGVQHEAEIPFVFANPPLQGAKQAGVPEPLRTYASDANLKQVSDLMSAAWIHFANRLDPNGRDVAAKWTQYNKRTDADGNGKVLYVQANNVSMSPDDLEAAQVQFVIDNKQYFDI